MRKRTLSLVAAAVVGCLGFAGPARALLLSESGDFVAYVEELRNLAFGSGSNLYIDPTVNDRASFAALASGLWDASTANDINAVVAAAEALSYDVVSFTDLGSGNLYLGLREQLVANVQQTGWGSFFVKQETWREAMVQVPHPIADTRSWEVAAIAYVASDARGFLMAGAHRNANGAGTADVADPIGSIFQVVHEQWNGVAGEVTAWQIHGFDLTNYPTYPASTDAVLSNGTGGVSPEITALDAALQNASQGWISHAYNTLDPLDPLNVGVNGAVDGELFGPPGGLGATTNAQRVYSTGIGGTFVHVELEQSIRLNGAQNREIAGQAIGGVIEQTSQFIPEPNSLAFLAVGAVLSFLIRRGTRSEI